MNQQAQQFIMDEDNRLKTADDQRSEDEEDKELSQQEKSSQSSALKSSVNSAAAKARALAEAASAKVAFAKKELQIKKEKARLDLEKAMLQADLEALEMEKEAAAALAEATSLEAAVNSSRSSRPRSSVSPRTVRDRTEEYVKKQNQLMTHSTPFSLRSAPTHITLNATGQSSPMKFVISERSHSQYNDQALPSTSHYQTHESYHPAATEQPVPQPQVGLSIQR